MRQHLTAVEAAAEVGQARSKARPIGSTRLVFRPGTVKPGNYTFSVGHGRQRDPRLADRAAGAVDCRGRVEL